MKPHIIDFLNFLESKENKKVPFMAKLLHPNKFSPITKEELNVKGDLNLKRSKIEFLPDNLTVGGDLDLSYVEIKSLPNNLKVAGYLNLDWSSVESLPDNLLLLGSLRLEGTSVKSIPNNLYVGGDLYTGNTPLAELITEDEIRQEIEQKGGDVEGEIHT